MSDGVHRTEIDGYQVTWCLHPPHLIAIMAVHDNGRLLASFEPGAYPDLVQARELLPRLEKLWDAVRHDFWTNLCPPPHRDVAL